MITYTLIFIGTLVFIGVIGWFIEDKSNNPDNEDLYNLIKDNEHKIEPGVIGNGYFSFHIGDRQFIMSTGEYQSHKYVKIGSDFEKYLSPKDYNKIFSIVESISYNSIKRDIGGFKLDSDIQKAIDDTAKIQEAHAQIEFLTKQVQLIKSSYVNRGKE